MELTLSGDTHSYLNEKDLTIEIYRHETCVMRLSVNAAENLSDSISHQARQLRILAAKAGN